MLKKYSLLFFLMFSVFFGTAQNDSGKDFLADDQKIVDGFVERKSTDSAFRFLQKFDSNSLSYFLSWKTLAQAYWEKGDMANSSAIAFWVQSNVKLFQDPNDLYPQLHHLIGNIYFVQNQLDSAIVNYEKTIGYREKFIHQHDTMLLDTYQNLSQVYSRLSDSANTFLYLNKAKEIVYLQTNNVLQLSSIKARFADSYSRLGYYALAENYYSDAINLLDIKNIAHQKELSVIYTQKGRLSFFIGKFSESIALYSQSINFLDKAQGSPYEKANIYEQLADVHYMLKDYDNALHMYLKSDTILKALLPDNHSRIITLHTDLAAVYKGLGDYEKAIYYFSEAASKSKLSAYQYRVFGETYLRVDSLDKAERYLLLAKSIAESRPIIDKEELGDAQFFLGSYYLETKRNKLKCLRNLNLAIEEYRSAFGDKNEPMGRALLMLAKYYIQENNTEKALEILQSSIIALSPGFNSKNTFINPERVELQKQSVANTLGWKALALADHYKKTKDIDYLVASFDTYQLSLKMIDGFRLSQKYGSNLILNKEVNNLLNQAIEVSYLLYTLTKEQRYFEAAFSFIEQNKSTALLASLQQNDSIRLSNVPTALVEKENSLKQNLLSLEEKMGTIASSNANQKLSSEYLQQKNDFHNSLDSIQKILAINHPEYYRLFYGNNVISIDDVQKQLSRNKVLVDYAITDSLLLVYVISKGSAELYSKKMPPNFDTDILRLLQLLRSVNTENSDVDYQSFIKLAFENYQFLLGDFAQSIKGKEVLIVPDGILSYLPFDVLLTDTIAKEQPDYRELHYFLRENVCSTLNSAAIYFSYSKKKTPNSGQIIAFAPSYSIFDTINTSNSESYNLLPLNYVKYELESISLLFDPKILKGDKATKANFLNLAPKGSVLHLAMHAVLNDTEPLKSQLVFSPDSESNLSGLFTVSELFGMELSADLAVLSACNSGNGMLNKGEGIMSLSTGFQYAGVPSVVMTHWDVNDKYSADLMAGFYSYLARGMDKNLALHRSKIDLLNSSNAMYSHPYYWAGFTLIGNETAIVSSKSGFAKSIEYLIPIIILLVFFFFSKRKPNG